MTEGTSSDSGQYRRRFIKTAGAFGLAGALAGCEETGFEDEEEREPTTLPPIETVTTIDSTPIESCDTTVLDPTADTGEFTLWHGREEAGARLLQGTQRLFNQFGPTMKVSRVSSVNFLTKLRSAIPAGEGPHTFTWAHDIGGEFTENGLLVDEGDELRIDPCVYTDSAWQAANYDSQTIGLPFAAEGPALIYNEDILDDMGRSVPTTLSEMTAIMDEYQDQQNGKYGLAFPLNGYFASWAAQAFGGEIYDGEEDELGIATEEVVRGLNIIYEDLEPYMPSDPAYGAQRSVFYDGNAPFFINGPWTTSGLQDKDFEFGVTKIPAPSGGTPRPYMGVKLVYFAKKMERDNQATNAARQFAEWYTTSDKRMLNLANELGMVPVKSNLIGNDRLPEIAKGFSKQVVDGYPMPQNPKMNAVWGPWGTAVLEGFNSRNPDVMELLEEAEKKIRNSETWEN